MNVIKIFWRNRLLKKKFLKEFNTMYGQLSIDLIFKNTKDEVMPLDVNSFATRRAINSIWTSLQVGTDYAFKKIRKEWIKTKIIEHNKNLEELKNAN